MNPEQLAVATAAHTARQGNLPQALQLLTNLQSAEAVDLRARVLAQLGRWQEANTTWATLDPAETAAELSPSATAGHQSPHLHPGTGVEVGASAGHALEQLPDGRASAHQALAGHPLAQQVLDGRALAQKVLAGRVRQRPVVRPVAAAAVAILVIGGITTGTALAVSRPEPVVAEPRVEPSVAPRTVTVTPTEQLDELDRRIAAEKAAAARLDAIAASVAMPGVTVRREPGAVRVVFDRGLFTSGTTFADGGVELLTRLAPKLHRVPGITVVGQSVAVPGGEATGGSSTALARARVAAQLLARAGRLPLTRLALASGDQAHPLFPGQARNRTVSLLLTA
ncbi:hypothetical protein GCM10009745_21690 [Kribbella yunnanensis]|uniref:OmpA-like domain-containing protein n=1 Tax=Kribbella yunnanensis TaxID=190194 RepID=A0ABN2GW73_9ACTN